MGNESGAPSGISSAGTSANVETLSPAVSVMPSNLSVQITTAAPGNGIEVALVDTKLNLATDYCTVLMGSFTCTDATATRAPLPASDPFVIEISNLAPAGTWTSDVLFGYQLSG